MPISPAQASIVSATIPNANAATPANASVGNVATSSGAAQIHKVNEEAGHRAQVSPDANLSKAAVQNVVDAANAVLPSALAEKIGLSVDERSGQFIVQVTDQKSGDVIREFPSKEVRELQAALADFVGLVLNKVA